jgi:heptosyltransferase-2
MPRLLVRLPNWLGDALMARPALHAIRAAGAVQMRAVGPAGLVALLAADGSWERADPWPEDGPGRLRLRKELRAWRPDAALVLPPSFSSALFAWRTGARRRAGFAHEGRSFLLTHALRRRPRGDEHLSHEYGRLAAALGLAAADPPPAPRLAPPEAALREADALIARIGATGSPLALIGPGATYGAAKRWPAERFAATARALRQRGFRVLVCGTAAERATGEAVAAAADADLVAGATTLAGQAGLCARARVAVCNDSGLAHLAAAVGTHTVAVFGSTSSAWTAPLGAGVRVVQRPPVCSPCFRRTCAIGYRCLTAVEVADVLAACEGAA